MSPRLLYRWLILFLAALLLPWAGAEPASRALQGSVSITGSAHIGNTHDFEISPSGLTERGSPRSSLGSPRPFPIDGSTWRGALSRPITNVDRAVTACDRAEPAAPDNDVLATIRALVAARWGNRGSTARASVAANNVTDVAARRVTLRVGTKAKSTTLPRRPRAATSSMRTPVRSSRGLGLSTMATSPASNGGERNSVRGGVHAGLVKAETSAAFTFGERVGPYVMGGQ